MGWKAFWSEIAIVVLGVVIALAANQVVEMLTWRAKVLDGEVRLRRDVEDAFISAAEQHVTAPCIEAQLAALTRNVMESGSTLQPAPVFSDSASPRFVVRAPYRPHRFEVWGALVANGTAPHFSRQRQRAFSRLSNEMAQSRLATDESYRLSGRLMAMAYPIALDASVRLNMLVDLETLRHRNALDMLTSQQRMESIIASFGHSPTAREMEGVDDFLGKSGTVMFCKERGLPLGNWRDVIEQASVRR